RAVEADHHHRGESGELDRHPHEPDVVGDEREVHGEHQELIHRVIEAQVARLEPAGLELVRDIAGAEEAGGEADQPADQKKHGVDIVDEEIERRLRPVRIERRSARQRERTDGYVQRGRDPIARNRREDDGAARGDREQAGERQAPEPGAHASPPAASPRDMSSACRSTVSKRSRMRNRNIPTIARATSAMPKSIVGPILTTASIVRWMPRRTTIRCRATGMNTPLKASAMSAVM